MRSALFLPDVSRQCILCCYIIVYIYIQKSSGKYHRQPLFNDIQVMTSKSFNYSSVFPGRDGGEKPFISPSAFGATPNRYKTHNFPNNKQFNTTSKMVESVWANIGFFPRHLDPEIRRIVKRRS